MVKNLFFNFLCLYSSRSTSFTSKNIYFVCVFLVIFTGRNLVQVFNIFWIVYILDCWLATKKTFKLDNEIHHLLVATNYFQLKKNPKPTCLSIYVYLCFMTYCQKLFNRSQHIKYVCIFLFVRYLPSSVLSFPSLSSKGLNFACLVFFSLLWNYINLLKSYYMELLSHSSPNCLYSTGR